MKIKLPLLIIVASLLASCDPVHNISFINKTNNEAKVKILVNRNGEPFFLEYESEYDIKGDSIVIHIPAKESRSIFFGIGTWGDGNIEELADAMKSMEIETEGIKTTYKTPASRTNLFTDELKGFLWKTEIAVKIDEP